MDRKKPSKKHQIENLRQHKANLEATYEIKYWLKFQRFQPVVRAKLYREWDDYFVAVQKTKAYRRHAKINKLIKQGQLAEAKDWIAKANEQRRNNAWELKKPAGLDPRWLRVCGKVSQYQRIMVKLSQLLSGDSGAGDVMAELM